MKAVQRDRTPGIRNRAIVESGLTVMNYLFVDGVENATSHELLSQFGTLLPRDLEHHSLDERKMLRDRIFYRLCNLDPPSNANLFSYAIGLSVQHSRIRQFLLLNSTPRMSSADVRDMLDLPSDGHPRPAKRQKTVVVRPTLSMHFKKMISSAGG
jgi:hypothetical protein